MATAPCPFGRPLGMELLNRTVTEKSPDFSSVMASHLTSFGNGSFRPTFYLKGDLFGSRNYIDLLVQSMSPCGRGRAHLLTRSGDGRVVLIENYNFNAGKGDYYEFEKIRSRYVGTTYLLDLDRIFPPDDTHKGEIVQVRFSGDVQPSQLESLLKPRGYQLAIVEDVAYEAMAQALNDHKSHGAIWGYIDQAQPGSTLLCRLDAFGRKLYTPFTDDIIPQGSVVIVKKL